MEALSPPPSLAGNAAPETPPPVRPKDLVAAVGISNSYATMLLKGDRTPPLPLALRIWRATGAKLGQIEALTDDECEQLDRLTGAVAAVATPAPAPRRPIVAMGEGFAG